jgi:hypothetical protein
MAYEKEFDVTLINANLDDTLKKAELLIKAFIQN